MKLLVAGGGVRVRGVRVRAAETRYGGQRAPAPSPAEIGRGPGARTDASVSDIDGGAACVGARSDRVCCVAKLFSVARLLRRRDPLHK